MKFARSSGILLHLSSLPGRYGIGHLGKPAHEFVEFLAAAGQRLWQLLPVGPTGYADSPYQCFSAFAGNPLFIDLDRLQEQGLISEKDLHSAQSFPEEWVDYGSVIRFKLSVLQNAAAAFLADRSDSKNAAFARFCDENAAWLDDFALFMACKEAHAGAVWTEWEPGIRRRNPDALRMWAIKLSPQIEVFKFWQFEFSRQWEELISHCRQLGIRTMGDIPMYVAHDSADVWAHPELFFLDADGRAIKVAGVPPDYFSATGQLWGNPLYKWDVASDSGYAWWIERFRSSLQRFDMVRLDHFRGFQAYWEIPAGDPTAEHGQWVKGPGGALFRALEDKLGELPIIAENLGVITGEVEALRQQFGFPGMSLLQFAFGSDPQATSFQPHNYPRELVAYTGGHDNDTTEGWWTTQGAGDSTRTVDDIREERDRTRRYLGFEGGSISWAFIRAVLASVADIAILPLQDVLQLDSTARMNIPGTVNGNWKWRCLPNALTSEIADRLRALTNLYGR